MLRRSRICSYLSITILLFSCSNQYKLESIPVVNVKNACYSRWDSGIKEGGAGLNLSILTDENDTAKKLIGVYFRNKYANLKFSKPNIYSGFIRTSNGEKELDRFEGDKSPKRVSQDQAKDIHFPFKLTEDEAVIVCLDKYKKKYFKVQLKQDKTIGIPQ